MSNKTESLEPSDLGKLQTGRQATLWRQFDAIATGEGRWMPLNARLQELIDRKRPFEELVDEARFYLEVDNRIVAALGDLALALAAQEHGSTATDDDGIL